MPSGGELPTPRLPGFFGADGFALAAPARQPSVLLIVLPP